MVSINQTSRQEPVELMAQQSWFWISHHSNENPLAVSKDGKEDFKTTKQPQKTWVEDHKKPKL